MSTDNKYKWTQTEVDAYVSRFGLNVPAEQRERALNLANGAAQLGNRLVRCTSKFDEPAGTCRIPLV